jgi:hypothetical protein
MKKKIIITVPVADNEIYRSIIFISHTFGPRLDVLCHHIHSTKMQKEINNAMPCETWWERLLLTILLKTVR